MTPGPTPGPTPDPSPAPAPPPRSEARAAADLVYVPLYLYKGLYLTWASSAEYSTHCSVTC
ncbi:hypothetical protein ABT143_36845, partial [Streptomyces sp. NPDC002033]